MEQEYIIAGNLQDAGCAADFIEHFMQVWREGKIPEQLRILSEQRNLLLDGIHDGQKKLDCLDYLIFQIRREQSQ